MFIDKLMNKFGYSEMYEWSELFKYNIVPFGRFVTFDENNTEKIKLANKGDYIIGVTTVNTVCTSDDPEEWQAKYLCNEYGDYFLQKKKMSNKQESKQESEFLPIINNSFDESKDYKKRSERQEWIRVNLLGKCIVVDNGKCQPGKFCTVGKNGIAIPYESIDTNKWYVLNRITDKTIMIFFK